MQGVMVRRQALSTRCQSKQWVRDGDEVYDAWWQHTKTRQTGAVIFVRATFAALATCVEQAQWQEELAVLRGERGLLGPEDAAELQELAQDLRHDEQQFGGAEYHLTSVNSDTMADMNARIEVFQAKYNRLSTQQHTARQEHSMDNSELAEL